MPPHWYNNRSNKVTETDTPEEAERKRFNESICAEKKPYFTIYIYPENHKAYKDFIKTANRNSMIAYGMPVDELEKLPDKTEEQQEFLRWYHIQYPVTDNGSTMNKICHRIEAEFDGYFTEIKAKSNFDYTIMKSGQEHDRKGYKAIEKLYEEYVKMAHDLKTYNAAHKQSSEEYNMKFTILQESFQSKCFEVCPNMVELCDIILDICYKKTTSKQFAWKICSDQIINNVLQRSDYTLTYLTKDENGDIEYCGNKFKACQIKVGEDNDNSE